MARMVEVDCKVVRRNENSIVVRDGRTIKVPGANGEVKEREIEVVLPRSKVEEGEDGTLTMPEWLARDRGLI